MTQYSDFEIFNVERHGEPHADRNDAAAPLEDVRAVEPVTPGEALSPGPGGEDTWHSEAGRKGAQRIHQLIEEGRLYEKEHGLKRGRQRLRQLIELGKIYEREHGLHSERPPDSRRLSRMSKKQALRNLFEALVRVAKPSLRQELLRTLRALDDEAAA